LLEETMYSSMVQCGQLTYCKWCASSLSYAVLITVMSMNTEHLFNNGFVFLTVLYYTDIHSSQNMYSLHIRKNNNGIYP